MSSEISVSVLGSIGCPAFGCMRFLSLCFLREHS